MKKRAMALIMSGILVVTLSGCASNPEKSIVKEKNMDKMLEEAQQADDKNSYKQVQEEVKQYETYQTQIEDDKLKVSVQVDAKVEVPEVEKLSVYRVSQKKIKQDFLDSIRKVLTPDVTYYDGWKKWTDTKSDIAKSIKYYEDEIEKAEKEGDTVMVEENKEGLKREQEEYKKAPDKINLTDYPLDNKIQKIQTLYDSNPEDGWYSWLHELHGDGEMFYGLSDGADSNYQSLYMQNCGNYGNCLRYDCNKTGYSDNVYHADVGTDIPQLWPWEKDEKPNFYNDDHKMGIVIEETDSVECVDNEPLTISLEEAQEKVEAFLNQAGLKDYACYEKGKFSQLIDKGYEEGDSYQYRNVYRFLCLRKLDDVFVNNQAGFKLVDEWRGNDYVKKMWENEAVAICVNDSGIVDFYYLSPLSIDETVVEESSIKPFSEIKDTFEQMVVIENASMDLEGMTEDQKVSIKVTDVRLVYTRISEKDSFDTGLVVPVWDFEGAITDEYGYEQTGNILSINAIDGSVIDPFLGY